MKIFYLGFYNSQNTSKSEREYIPAAQTKMNFIIDTFKDLNCKLHLISMNSSVCKKNQKSQQINLDKNVDLRYFYSFSKNNILFKILNHYFLRIQLILYFLKYIKSNDCVIVYHSIVYLNIIKYLKKILNFKLILEMEEIYGDVYQNSDLRFKELKFAKLADSFIFPTVLLNEIANPNNKPYIIIHGTYKAEAQRKKIFKDDKVHVVYAGTLDPRKGALATVESAFFLPENYHIHILGFGSKKDVQSIKERILRINSNSLANITFEGLLSGEEFIKFVQSCDIGLCTQNPYSTFNNTSFPSKILMYLSNGLRVVSINIPAIKTSKINSILYYYDIQSPKNIAEAIKNIDLNKEYDSKSLINQLNLEFKNELKKMLKGFDMYDC